MKRLTSLSITKAMELLWFKKVSDDWRIGYNKVKMLHWVYQYRFSLGLMSTSLLTWVKGQSSKNKRDSEARKEYGPV